MRAIAAGMGLGMLLAGASAWTQSNPQEPASSPQTAGVSTSPDYTAVYCSGYVTSERNDETRLISGEESNSKVVFTTRDYVFISKGSNQGVRVGDRYSVVRPDKDADVVQWFKWQHKLLKAMGTYYIDMGQLKVINVQPNVSTAEVTFACDYLQRGDVVHPFQERPTPPYKAAPEHDRFAPVSGKSVGMLVAGKDFAQTYGKFSTAFVNLGTNQGVKVGDYLRVFRYQGSHAENAPNFDDYQYKMYGFGSTPQAYQWNDLPREILGEGIVLNVGPNSSTLLVTTSRIEMYAGDYVEIE
ncbi:MAG TPA: hypothetical protein VMT75_09750 [Candidatus Saccharimonadales bacterium]|nr:hypothetical protein [Candidatus Saccharimonadales bacterium]